MTGRGGQRELNLNVRAYPGHFERSNHRHVFIQVVEFLLTN